jgi:hypothetical protein
MEVCDRFSHAGDSHENVLFQLRIPTFLLNQHFMLQQPQSKVSAISLQILSQHNFVVNQLIGSFYAVVSRYHQTWVS